MVFLVLKTARYVDPRRSIELGELLVFLGDGLRHHGAPRRGQRRCRPVREAPRGRTPSACATARARCSTRSSTASSTTTRRPSTGSRHDIEEVEDELFSGERARTRPSASTGSSARCSSSARPPRRWSTRSSRLARGQLRADPPGDPRLLPRRQRPPDPRARPARRDARPAASSSLQANLAQVARAPERGRAARSPPGSRSSRCRRRSPASTA